MHDKTSYKGAVQDVRDLLIIIIDLTPTFWGINCSDDFNIFSCLDAVLAFANVQLMLSPLHEVAIIGVTADKASFLCPTALEESDALINSIPQDGQYKMLAVMNEAVRQKAIDIASSCESLSNNVIIAGAVIKSLCYYLRRCRELQPNYAMPNIQEGSQEKFGTSTSHLSQLCDKIRARILVVRAADDNPSQYLSLMNVIFTAQKLNVPIDACILPSISMDSSNSKSLILGHSSLFQQAADLTGGIYLQIPRPASLLQYLISVFLPRPGMRPHLLLPNNRSSIGCGGGVDFRAACFCHRRLVDMGYVCSVCLSVFCEFTPLCSTCQTPFKVPTAPSFMANSSLTGGQARDGAVNPTNNVSSK